MATAAEKVCRIVYSATALANDGAFVAEIDGGVVRLFLAAPRVFASGALVEVVLATDIQ